VEMAAAESDDAIEIGLDRFRDEGLQNVAFDGEAFDAGEPKDAARASGDRYGDLSSANLAARAGDADYRVPLAQKACHLAILDDVHATPVGRPRIAPSNRIVAGGAGARLQEPADHGKACGGGKVHAWDLAGDLLRREPHAVAPAMAHGVAPADIFVGLRRRMRKVKDAALGE